jgi:hypothetical protein
MIPRYAPVDATALFTERHRFATMLADMTLRIARTSR